MSPFGDAAKDAARGDPSIFRYFLPIIYKMFPGGLIELLKQVVSSWQVQIATVILVLYIFIVNYAARSHHRRPSFTKLNFKKKKKASPAADSGGPEETASSSDSNEELGLEEA